MTGGGHAAASIAITAVLAWAGCEAMQRAVALAAQGFLARGVAATIGRVALVVTLVGVAVARFGGDPAAVACGALAGWLLAAGRDAWRWHRTLARFGTAVNGGIAG